MGKISFLQNHSESKFLIESHCEKLFRPQQAKDRKKKSLTCFNFWHENVTVPFSFTDVVQNRSEQSEHSE